MGIIVLFVSDLKKRKKKKACNGWKVAGKNYK